MWWDVLLVIAVLAAVCALAHSVGGTHPVLHTNPAALVAPVLAAPTSLTLVADDADVGRGFVDAAAIVAAARSAPCLLAPQVSGRADAAKATGDSVGDMAPPPPPGLWRAWAVAALAATHGGVVLPAGTLLLPGGGALLSALPSTVLGGGSGGAPVTLFGAVARDARGQAAWRSVADALRARIVAGPSTWNDVDVDRAVTRALRPLRSAAGAAAAWTTRADGEPLDADALLGYVADAAADAEFVRPPGAAVVLLDADAVRRGDRFGWFVRQTAGELLASTRCADTAGAPCLWQHLAIIG